MPGLVKSIACKPGDMVAEGQELCVIGQYYSAMHLAIFSLNILSLSLQVMQDM